MTEHSPTSKWLLTGVLLNRDARWVGPHLWRFGFLVVLFLTLWTASNSIARRTAPGLDVLQSLTTASAMGLIALATAGVGSLFRDEWLGNNLDLLQLTGVSGFDLLLAKLIPLWLTAISLLLLEIPCFLLCITLGGVTLLQVAAVIWQLAWLFLVSSSLTVLAAALFRRPQTIVVVAGAWLGLYCLATWLIFDLMNYLLMHPAVNWIAEFRRIFASGFTGPVISWPVLVHATAVGTCLYSASRTLRKRLLQPREAQSVEETAPEGEAHRSDIPVWRPSYRLPVIEGNAIEWKDYHFTLGGDEMLTGKWGVFTICLVFVVMIGVPMVMAATMSRGDIGPCVAMFALMLVLAPLGSLVHMANRLWMQEIREQTLSGLVLLPISAKDIIHAKLRTFLRMSVPEIAFYAVEFVVIFIASGLSGFWGLCGLFVALMVSIPMIVCTDAAWRLIPRTWDGLSPRAFLAGSVLGAWIISGSLASCGAPVLGLLVLAFLAPFICRHAIDIASHWLGNHSGELVD